MSKMAQGVAIALAISLMPAGPTGAQNAERLVLDEGMWVAFYDLPSRRFRTVRGLFVQRNFEQASQDLAAAIAFFRIEADRAAAELAPAMNQVAARLDYIRDNIASDAVTGSDLDAVFARAHWLLTQHYLVLARDARDGRRHRSAGEYLFATAHHLERSVLWSNARIDRDTVRALDSLRALAGRLRSNDNPEKVYGERPIRLAVRTVARVGEHLERTLRIESLAESES